MILGVDIGKSGGIANDTLSWDMPIKKRIIKDAIYVLDKDSKGRKQVYKTGPNKGKVKKKLKTAAKYATELDLKSIYNIFKDASVVVFEGMQQSFGNSAKSTKTTAYNEGKLHAVAELANCTIVVVPPHKWKKDMKLSNEKIESVQMAEQLRPHEKFRTPKGRLLDGRAEAILIREWWINQKEEEDEKTNK